MNKKLKESNVRFPPYPPLTIEGFFCLKIPFKYISYSDLPHLYKNKNKMTVVSCARELIQIVAINLLNINLNPT
jgi:hypothetical protein